MPIGTRLIRMGSRDTPHLVCPYAEWIRPINARAETVATKWTWRDAFAHRRCVISACGWYEWLTVASRKQPYYFHRPDLKPLLLAGLYREGPERDGFVIVTKAPQPDLASIHDRMPAPIMDADLETWLGPDTPTEALLDLLGPTPAEAFRAYPVRAYVSRASNDGPTCIEPLPTG
jgi:putative SOS response-associated peptidase YedK